jgi:hypothetical protein
MECEGPPSDHIDVDVSDDTGLSVIFKPPSTFGCNGWQAKT